MTLATLAEAIDWVETRWPGQRPAPMRLHTRGTEGRFTVQGNEETYTGGSGERLGSPPFSPAFMAALTGSAAATMVVTVTTSDDEGVYERTVDRYRYPMTLALSKLSKVPRNNEPHPYAVIVALAGCGWNYLLVGVAFGVHPVRAEEMILRAIRRLHSNYQEGPIGRPSWVDKSDSQRQAEMTA